MLRKPIQIPESCLCFIVRASTGVSYTNQTGGHCCAHPTMEGYIDWPEEYSTISQALYEWVDEFGGSGRTTPSIRNFWVSGTPGHFAGEADLKRIERLGFPLMLDHEALRTECWGEAWIPCVISGDRRAIFTYKNSD